MVRLLIGLTFVVASAAILSPVGRADSGLSGVYVANGPTFALMLQLVAADDGRLSGRYEQVALRQDGGLDDMNGSVTGLGSGASVVVTIKPDGILTTPFTASGQLESGVLKLSSGIAQDSLNIQAKKGGLDDFRSEVTALNMRARQIIFDRQQRKIAEERAEINTQLTALASQMQEFLSKTPMPNGGFSKAEGMMRDYTARMERGLERERSIVGGWQASTARSQVNAAISTVSGQAVNYNGSLENYVRSSLWNAERLQADWIKLAQSCDGSNPIPTCSQAKETYTQFRARVDQIRRAFAHAESVWQEEQKKQQSIIGAANAALQ
jgi:hypothetical protein